MLAARIIILVAGALLLSSGHVTHAQTSAPGPASAAPTAAPSGPTAPAARVPGNPGEASSITLPTVQVVGVTPLPGSGVDIDKVPAN
jgi:hypothetical protein